jgi:hypothetical protein
VWLYTYFQCCSIQISVLNKVYKFPVHLHSSALIWVSVGWFQRQETVSSTPVIRKLLFRDHRRQFVTELVKLNILTVGIITADFTPSKLFLVEFEVLTGVVRKSTISWDTTPCSLLKVNRRFGGKYCPLATCFHAGFLLGLFFDPEDGGNMFLRNVGWLSTDCTALYPRRQYSSSCFLFF